jgi:hypothetical protein
MCLAGRGWSREHANGRAWKHGIGRVAAEASGRSAATLPMPCFHARPFACSRDHPRPARHIFTGRNCPFIPDGVSAVVLTILAWVY